MHHSMKNCLRYFICFALTAVLLAAPFKSNAQERLPVIGISASKPSGVGTNYVNAVRKAGGVPVIIPITGNQEKLSILLDSVDGLIMTGGEDVAPERYGEKPVPELEEVYLERDDFDIKLIRMAVSKGLPVLGICRGAQVMNVAFGGTLYQDIPSQIPQSELTHRVSAANKVAHSITISEGTLLHDLLGGTAEVNSSHHQSVKKVAPGFVISAVAEDGVVEAIEKKGVACVIGVQFHPEGFVANGNDSMMPVFLHLVRTAAISNAHEGIQFDGSLQWPKYQAEDVGPLMSCIILFACFLALCIWLMSNKKSSCLFKFFSNNLLVISSIVWLLGVIVYIVGFYRHGLYLNWLSVIPRAVLASFKMFVVTNELARVDPQLQGSAIYMIVFSMTHFIAALVTFIFIFRLLGYKMRSAIKLKWHCWNSADDKTVHLFWGMNDASFALAKDLKGNGDTIIIIDIDRKSDQDGAHKPSFSSITNAITISDSEMALVDEIGALVDHCYNGPAHIDTASSNDVFGLLKLNTVRKILQKSRELNMYILSDNESENIYAALNLQEDKCLSALTNTPKIFVHARRDSYNEVYAHYAQYAQKSSEFTKMKIDVVDSAFLSIQALKQNDDTLPVSCVDVNPRTGTVDDPFNALIVGFGATGQEAFKFLYEFSTFIDSNRRKTPFKCYALDERMDRIEGLLRTRMPDILKNDEELELIKTSVDSALYWDMIRELINKLNYVVITLNNDTLGMTAAVNLFKYAINQRDATLPVLKIILRCYDSDNEKRMMEVEEKLNESAKGRNVEIRLFGRTKDVFTSRNVVAKSIFNQAKEFHYIYENSLLPVDKQWKLTADQQWERSFERKEDGTNVIDDTMNRRGISRYHAIYEINRRISQNFSNVLHSRTILILMGLASKDKVDMLKRYHDYVETRAIHTTTYRCDKDAAELLYNMAMSEHERWVAAHKLLGYRYDRTTDYVKKYHECMCDFEKLDEIKQSYDFNVVDTTIKLAYKNACDE